MPQNAFWDFYKQIMAQTDTYCEIDYYNTLYCTYDPVEYEKLPELFFKIDGKDYKVPRESLYVVLDDYSDLMAVEVTYIRGWNEWLFGLTFLQNYYTVYDMEEQKVGFAISKSSIMAPQNTILPIEEFEVIESTVLLATPATEQTTSEWGVASIAAAAVVPIAAMGLLYKMLRSKKSGTEPTDEKFKRIC